MLLTLPTRVGQLFGCAGDTARPRPVVAESLEGRTLFAALPVARADVDFQVGHMVGDTKRNLVYVADQSNHRILAIDTAAGTTVTARTLPGIPDGMSMSLDGNQLFVAEPLSNKIEVLA